VFRQVCVAYSSGFTTPSVPVIYTIGIQGGVRTTSAAEPVNRSFYLLIYSVFLVLPRGLGFQLNVSTFAAQRQRFSAQRQHFAAQCQSDARNLI
jgi:hypothetical protein